MYRDLKFLTNLVFSLSILLPSLYAEPSPKPVVSVEKVASQDIYDLFYFPVSLQAQEESSIVSEFIAVVEELPVKLGQEVKKGQVLLTLEHLKPEFFHAHFQVKSPISGQIASIKVKVGTRVSSGEQLLQVVNPRKLMMIAEIPQKVLQFFSVHLEGTITFRAVAEPLPVLISGISPQVSSVTGTSTAELAWNEILLSSSEREAIARRLLPGMVGTVEFKLHKRRGIVIPNEAIAFEKQGYIVRLVVNGRIVKRPIKKGKELPSDHTEVQKGLQEGETLVVSRTKYLRENEEVSVQEVPEAPVAK
jgi:multidrug efflux pump subunit AcrA (membrane-fusion protein)